MSDAANRTTQQKKELRNRIRVKLAAMDAVERHEKSMSICQRLLNLDAFGSAQTVMMYMPLPEEVDVVPVALACFQQGKSVCVPRVNWKRKDMTPIEVQCLNDHGMDLDEHGIRTPRDGEMVLPEMIDMIIIPGLAYDASGNRLGRGAGYYDRFLARVPKRTSKIGVAFDLQIVDAVPMGERDVHVDFVITERRATKTPCRVR